MLLKAPKIIFCNTFTYFSCDFTLFYPLPAHQHPYQVIENLRNLNTKQDSGHLKLKIAQQITKYIKLILLNGLHERVYFCMCGMIALW